MRNFPLFLHETNDLSLINLSRIYIYTKLKISISIKIINVYFKISHCHYLQRQGKRRMIEI